MIGKMETGLTENLGGVRERILRVLPCCWNRQAPCCPGDIGLQSGEVVSCAKTTANSSPCENGCTNEPNRNHKQNDAFSHSFTSRSQEKNLRTECSFPGQGGRFRPVEMVLRGHRLGGKLRGPQNSSQNFPVHLCRKPRVASACAAQSTLADRRPPSADISCCTCHRLSELAGSSRFCTARRQSASTYNSEPHSPPSHAKQV